jgi:hypothetical protein
MSPVASTGRLFRGSELPRLLVLTAIMVVGWGLVWQFARHQTDPVDDRLPARAVPHPEPVVPDRDVSFESVTDRTPMSFRDNAAYAHLLEKARELSASELAGQSRRDIFLTHLWDRPELYRGVPIHLLGTALRVLRYESGLSKTGWLYEIWIITPDARKFPYCCVCEDPPAGFPVGENISERVVFNGFFLKIMKYQASDLPRGAPVLVGKVGWEPHAESTGQGAGAARINPTLYWTLVALGGLFLLSLARWIVQLYQFLGRRRPRSDASAPTTELNPDALNQWLNSMEEQEEEGDEPSGD